MSQQQSVTFGRRGGAPAPRFPPPMPGLKPLPGAAHAAPISEAAAIPGSVSLDYLLGRAETASASEGAVGETDMMRFIGANWPKYRELWREMRVGGELKPSFSFAAFFLTTFWLLYRKLYAYAFAAFGATLIINFVAPEMSKYMNIALCVTCGLYGKSLVVQRAMNTVKNIRAMGMGGEGTTLRIEKAGGTNWIAPTILSILVGVSLLIVIAAAGVQKAAEKASHSNRPGAISRKI